MSFFLDIKNIKRLELVDQMRASISDCTGTVPHYLDSNWVTTAMEKTIEDLEHGVL